MSFFAKNRGRGWFISLSFVLLVIASMQSVLYLTCYDSGIGLYRQGFSDGALKIGYLLAACAILFCFVVFPLMQGKKVLPSESKRTVALDTAPSRAVECFALLAAAAIAATLITQLINLNAYDPLSNLLQNPTEANSTARTMHLCTLLFALPAALPFILVFTRKKAAYPLLFTLAWTCAYILRVYFDTSVLLMSPTRLMSIAALASVLLFLIAELRLARTIATPLFYGVSALLATLFAGVSGSSALVMTAAGLLPVNTETAFYAAQLAIALYALFRMKSVMADCFAAYAQAQSVEAADPAPEPIDAAPDENGEEI